MPAVRTGCALVLLSALCLWVMACGCNDAILARLDNGQGDVGRQRGGSAAWSQAQAGAEFRIGDALRTGHNAQAELTFVPDGRMRVQADTLIRFLEHPPDEKASPRMQVEQGQVVVEAATAPVEIVTSRGTTRLEKGSKVAIRLSERDVQLEVLVGRVLALDSGDVANAGERLRLELGQVVVESMSEPATDSARIEGIESMDGPQLAELNERKAATQPERITQPAPIPDQRAPGVDFPEDQGSWDFKLDHRGGTVTVHDPTPSTRIAFELAGCASVAPLELRSRGRSSRVERQGITVVALAPGLYAYRHRCQGMPKMQHRGSLHILQDAAVQQLPKTAPSAQLDADGRRYTVRYQNLLPALQFRWPEAPKSEGYRLELAPKGQKLRTIQSGESPIFEVPSGTLREGSHEFRLVAAGGRSSPHSQVTISFDNAARTAYISSPREQGFAAGDTLWIRGAALNDSSVVAAGEPIPLRSGGRFAKKVEVGSTPLLIQVSHPLSGTHYYLRRAAMR